MTITNPTLELTYTGNNRTATITSADIVINSISVEKQLLRVLEPSSNKVELTIARSCSEVENIISNETDIKAVFKNNGTKVFTGYLSTDYSWTVTPNGEQALSITIEDVGTRLLEKEFISSGYHTFNSTCENAVRAICTVAGVTIDSNAVFPVGNVVKAVEGAATCKDLLTKLLGEFNCVYYFNNLGKMLIHEVSCTSTTGIPEFDKTKLYTVEGTAIKLTKKIRQYKNARVTYKETGTASNYLVYRNTTKDHDTSNLCYLELTAGQHFDGTEKYTPQAGVTRSPAYIEAVNAASEESLVGSNEIMVVSDAQMVIDKVGSLSATVSVAGGKYLTFDAQNSGSSTGYFRQFDIKGSIIYAKSSNVIVTADEQVATTQSNNIIEEELEWIHTKTLAQRRANLLAQFHRYGNGTYTFHSTTSVALGTIVHLYDNAISGLDVNVMLIASKETDQSDVIQYTAVAVSVFNLDANVNESKVKPGSYTEADTATKLVSVTREYAISSSSSTAPVSGWVSSRSGITPTEATPYIWVRETMTYGDGSTAIGTPYVGEVYAVPDILEYYLSISPYEIIKDLRSSDRQIIILNAIVSGYNNPDIIYKFNGIFLGSRYAKTTDVTPQEEKTYYTFAQTQDRTKQSGKTYYLNKTAFYEECVNLESFLEDYTHYFERSTTTTITSNTYELSVDLHSTEVLLEVPRNNNYDSSVEIELFNGETSMDSLSVNVVDQTEYSKCVGLLNSDSEAFPSQTPDLSYLVEGDFVVFAEANTKISQHPEAGSVWYINSSGNWIKTEPKEKTAEKLIALQKLIEEGVNLKDLNETSVIQWFSEIVATSVTAEYIGAKEIQIQNGGLIRGGDYDVNGDIDPQKSDPQGFYLNSKGILKATNAEFNKVKINSSSTIKGVLQCGKDGDVMINTVFENSGAEKTYTATRSNNPEGFSWAEVYNYLDNIITEPSLSLWQSDADTDTLCPITKKTTTGKVAGSTVDTLIYTSNPVISCSTVSERYTNHSSATPNRTTTLHNPLPESIYLNYYFQRGIAKWKFAWDKGTRLTNCSYVITHADGTTTNESIFPYASSGATSASGTITLLAGDTITWTYGYIEAPSSNWNNGYASSKLTLSFVLDLEDGFNFYSSGERFLMPTTNFNDFSLIADGMSNLTFDGSPVLNLPASQAVWATGINKYYKYSHTFTSALSGVPYVYSAFNGCSAINITDKNGNLHGTLNAPVLSSLNMISISESSFTFYYNGEEYTQSVGDWVRGFSVDIDVPSVNKGVYTASIFPRASNSEDIGTTTNKYRSLHAVNVNGDVVTGGTVNAINADITTLEVDAIETDGTTIKSLVPKDNNSSIGTSSSPFPSIYGNALYCNNAPVFATNKIVFSSTYNLTALSIGEIGVFAGTPYVYLDGSYYKAKVILPSGGTYAYSFIIVGGYEAFRYSGYSSSVAGGSNVIVSGGSSQIYSGNVRVEFKYWRVS